MRMLSEAWLEACIQIWDQSNDDDKIGITLWDAFLYLYYTSVPINVGKNSVAIKRLR